MLTIRTVHLTCLFSTGPDMIVCVIYCRRMHWRHVHQYCTLLPVDTEYNSLCARLRVRKVVQFKALKMKSVVVLSIVVLLSVPGFVLTQEGILEHQGNVVTFTMAVKVSYTGLVFLFLTNNK